MSTVVETETPVACSQARVLLVEDDQEIRRALRSFLTEAGYPVDEAADGLAGLELFRQHRHAVVISDIQMPRLQGLARDRSRATSSRCRCRRGRAPP